MGGEHSWDENEFHGIRRTRRRGYKWSLKGQCETHKEYSRCSSISMIAAWLPQR